jgi:hypothetical protein
MRLAHFAIRRFVLRESRRMTRKHNGHRPKGSYRAPHNLPYF